MRVSASGELVKVEIGQVLRRSSRLRKPVRGSTASRRPGAWLVGASLGVAVVLVGGQPLAAAAAPGPDPHPSATQPAGAPAPDPAPASRQSAPTPDPVAEVTIGSSSAYEPAAQSSSPSTSVVRPRATKPAQRPNPVATMTPAAKALAVTARERRGNQPARVAATSIPATAAATAATDPMLLGALALFTLALSSAGLLLVVHRSERSGARA